MKNYIKLIFIILIAIANPAFAQAKKILFIGNSFTYGATASAEFFHPETVTDLNKSNIGGVPAIFKMLSQEAGLDYDVYVETIPGATLEQHYKTKYDILNQKWDVVVMHTLSILDGKNPGNPAQLMDYSQKFAQMFCAQNPNVKIYMTATWPRADQIYRPSGYWYGKTTNQMTDDIMNGYQTALKENHGNIVAVIPLGKAWENAFKDGIADNNPYDGTDYDKVNLWGWDSYHASNYGYYLHALMDFGVINDFDVTKFDKNDRAARELGISQSQAQKLQSVAAQTLKK